MSKTMIFPQKQTKETKIGEVIPLPQNPDEALVRAKLDTAAQVKVDAIRKHFEQLPQVNCPLYHRFTPGLYIREIFVPAGTLLVTKIHKTEHPFVMTKGRVAVWTEESGVAQLTAPHLGITKAGTRRIIYIHEDCTWLTFHPTEKTAVDDIEAEIILKPNEAELIDVDSAIINQLKEQ